MLIVKRKQLADIQSLFDSEQEETVFEHIRSHHQKMIGGLPDFVIRELIQTGIAKAKNYNLISDFAVGVFVSLMIEVAPNFDQYWKVQEILNLDMEDNKKITLIHERFHERLNDLDWQIAEGLYNENAWYE